MKEKWWKSDNESKNVKKMNDNDQMKLFKKILKTKWQWQNNKQNDTEKQTDRIKVTTQW